MKSGLPYLIAAVEYATTCSGTCPTCVLTKDERMLRTAAGKVAAICDGLAEAGRRYGRVGTLALGIGRANVLDLPEGSVAEIGRMVEAARRAFTCDELVVEITTSLVGRMDRQIRRAEEIIDASGAWNCDVRFVIVGNTALASEKYWRNLDAFHRRMTARRGGERDGNGDIIQLALATDSLPDVQGLVERMRTYRSPVNLTWAPAFDAGAASEERLAALAEWLRRWHDLTGGTAMDSSLVTRIGQTLPMNDLGLAEAVAHAEESGRAVVYVGTDGSVRQGLFSVLAEMDPVRFDPLSEAGSMSGTSARELGRLLRNPACSACPFTMSCIASGSHRSALIVLRNHPRGTQVCPSGLQGAFASASKDWQEPHGRDRHA